MVIEFIKYFSDTMIDKNQEWTPIELETALFKEGYQVVFCVPHALGCKFRVHLGNQKFIEGILTFAGEIIYKN